jgi:hypothetical protein
MCGIAGIHRLTPGPVRRGGKLANELLLAIENRGRDATGHLTITDGGKVRMGRAIVPAREYVRKGGVSFAGNPKTTLLHTRFATVGEITTENAHPVVNGPLAAIHNGTIYNHREIFREIKRKRNAAVDSEVIPAVVAHVGWDRAAKALARLRGGAATAIVDTKNPDALILARLDDYPMVLMVSESLIVWASTREAIERAWKKTYGATPNACQWIEVPAYTLLRVVGGKITIEAITPPPKPKPWKVSRRYPGLPDYVPGTGGANRLGAKKKNRKAGTKTKPTASSVTQPTLFGPSSNTTADEVEPYQWDAVNDLMREGATRAEAEEMTFGFVITDPDDAEDQDRIGCPDCNLGTIGLYDACDNCGLTFEALTDIYAWLDRDGA